MTTHNPIAFVRHLRFASGDVRAMADKADAILRRIACEQAELAAMEAEVMAKVTANWTAEDIAEAKADVLEDLKRA